MRSGEKQWNQTASDDGTTNYWQRNSNLDGSVNLWNTIEEFGLTGSEVKIMKKKTDRA